MSTEAVVKPGVESSEYEVSKAAEFWGTVTLICGLIVTMGAPILAALTDAFGPEGKVVAVLGVVVTVAGVVLKALVSLGYSAARANVKAAASLGGKEQP